MKNQINITIPESKTPTGPITDAVLKIVHSLYEARPYDTSAFDLPLPHRAALEQMLASQFTTWVNNRIAPLCESILTQANRMNEGNAKRMDGMLDLELLGQKSKEAMHLGAQDKPQPHKTSVWKDVFSIIAALLFLAAIGVLILQLSAK